MRKPRSILLKTYERVNLVTEPIVSIIIPVYNQEKNIKEVVFNLLESIGSSCEIILIDDASTDGTKEAVLSTFHFYRNYTNVAKVRFFSNRKPMFETFCDDFGIKKSSGKYCLEIQADMYLQDKNFDLRLVEALETDEKIIALSGRGVEPIQPVLRQYLNTLGTDRAIGTSIFIYILRRAKYQIVRPSMHLRRKNSKDFEQYPQDENRKCFSQTEKEFFATGEAGRLGSKILEPLNESYESEHKIYIGDTVMRGPLLIDRSKYFEVGGFDISSFFQGFDDHDFSIRSRALGFKVGYVPVRFFSPPEIGTTRKPRSFSSEISILKNVIRIRKKRTKTNLYLLQNEKLKKEISDWEILEFNYQV